MAVSRIGPKHQVTVTAEAFARLGLEPGDFLEVRVDAEALRLVPQKLIPKDQAWFWTQQWQQGEREADEDIEQDRVSWPFDSVDELVRYPNTHEA